MAAREREGVFVTEADASTPNRTTMIQARLVGDAELHRLLDLDGGGSTVHRIGAVYRPRQYPGSLLVGASATIATVRRASSMR